MARDIAREALREQMERGDGFVLVDVLGEPYYRLHLLGRSTFRWKR